jgi:hypothetical protein
MMRTTAYLQAAEEGAEVRLDDRLVGKVVGVRPAANGLIEATLEIVDADAAREIASSQPIELSCGYKRDS